MNNEINELIELVGILKDVNDGKIEDIVKDIEDREDLTVVEPDTAVRSELTRRVAKLNMLYTLIENQNTLLNKLVKYRDHQVELNTLLRDLSREERVVLAKRISNGLTALYGNRNIVTKTPIGYYNRLNEELNYLIDDIYSINQLMTANRLQEMTRASSLSMLQSLINAFHNELKPLDNKLHERFRSLMLEFSSSIQYDSDDDILYVLDFNKDKVELLELVNKIESLLNRIKSVSKYDIEDGLYILAYRGFIIRYAKVIKADLLYDVLDIQLEATRYIYNYILQNRG